jgi:ABC-2 type transport system ATP-binding protein
MSALTLTNIGKRFGARKVLSGVSMTLQTGARLWISGANGSGKSTLLQIVSGVLQPDAGSVAIFDVPLDRKRAALGALGYAPAAAEFPPHLLVCEILAFVATLKQLKGHDSHIHAMGQWNLFDVASCKPGTLSLGERKRLVLAAATLGAPRLLVLDEPTVGLDASGRAELQRYLAEHHASGGTQILTSHEGDPAATETRTLRGGMLG